MSGTSLRGSLPSRTLREGAVMGVNPAPPFQRCFALPEPWAAPPMTSLGSASPTRRPTFALSSTEAPDWQANRSLRSGAYGHKVMDLLRLRLRSAQALQAPDPGFADGLGAFEHLVELALIIGFALRPWRRSRAARSCR